jgi:hypothetical protein
MEFFIYRTGMQLYVSKALPITKLSRFIGDRFMKSVRKDAKLAALILGAGFLLSQTIRIEKSNPPVLSEIVADQSAQPLLRRACYNCHSNETVWPWYSNIAPASWLVRSDVKEARLHLNFSEWGTYSAEKQHFRLMGIADEIKDGGMPPWYYSAVHPDSRLMGAECEKVRSWTAAALDALNAKP